MKMLYKFYTNVIGYLLTLTGPIAGTVKKLNIPDEYFERAEDLSRKFNLYLTSLFDSATDQIIKRSAPPYSRVKKYYLQAEKLVMDLFLRDMIGYTDHLYSKIDFSRKYPLSSKYGILYIFLVVVALNLTGFNVLLTANNEPDYTEKGVNILHTVNSAGVLKDENTYFMPEMEIFQQIIRHSDINQPLALKIASIIDKESRKYDIDPYLILSVIQVESRFSPTAVSHKGARGLMQLMPMTGLYVAKKYDLPYKSTRSLYDPVTNIRLGIAYLSYLENIYDNMEYALFAYNHGPWNTKRIEKRFKNSRPYYVKAVMKFKEFLESGEETAES